MTISYEYPQYTFSCRNKYGKCPKISNTKAANKMAHANNADPDQTAPSGSALFANPPGILRKKVHKKQNLGKKSME